MRNKIKNIGLIIFSLVFPTNVFAHGVGEVYALPIPLKYYLGSAGLAVALSFFIFAYFLSSEKKSESVEKKYKVNWVPKLLYILRILVFLLVALISTCLFLGGFPHGIRNCKFIYR
jgi:membrane protease YdiL (CAAX protease family)